jgi:hypothetical protein
LTPQEIIDLENSRNDDGPETITPRQFRLILVQNGISLSSIEQAIDGIEDEEIRLKTKIEWEYSSEINRKHPSIIGFLSQFNLTESDLNEMFKIASEL